MTKNRTVCSSIGEFCAYCGRKLPASGEGTRECPEREEGRRDRAKYGQVTGEKNGI